MRVRSLRALVANVTSSSATSTLDYDYLRNSLAEAGAIVALAELHGGVCGALCAGGASAAQRWLAQSLQDQQLDGSADVMSELEELIAASAQTLEEDDLGFEPLLPSDDAPLVERVQALAVWCHGFLAGVGTTAPGIGRQTGDGAVRLAEIFSDFAEISRAGLSEEEAAGEAAADFSLAEIHEYVRVSVQLIHGELAAHRAAIERGLN